MKALHVYLLLVFVLVSCKTSTVPPGKEQEEEKPPPSGTEAVVSHVEVTGSAGNYTFNVTLSSPDTGCDQYADWWEVFSPTGTLVYRRILAHSHVNEQPFTRSGSSIQVNPDDSIYVRGHMNNLGYGSQVFSGTISGGLKAARLDTAFASELAVQAPLPGKCTF